MNFQAFPKIPRIAKCFFVTITEKIDGSNGQIVITPATADDLEDTNILAQVNGMTIRAGSRGRWVTPGKETDNYGFAAWVQRNAEELVKLGPGQHFGEWYGSGIQCGYGLSGGEKRFVLFNARRWTAPYQALKEGHDAAFPNCCEVVPVLYQGAFSTEAVKDCMDLLSSQGSKLVPGFMNPEGVIVEMNGERAKHTFQNVNGKWVS
ncbi:RNA ligase family protein [Agrobacterium pusense]|uniref:RNA ligase family protein n=1 Tax=Agrobacterium pusense TaxID=648995 RepID=UPI003850BF05